MLKNGRLINPEARIETTNKCNSHCIMCPREKMTRPLTTMGDAFFTNLVDQTVALGASIISTFGYGEPLLDPTLSEKILYCSGKGLDTYLTTNATLLDEEWSANLIYAGLKNIRFSLHATTPENYEKVHGKPWLPTVSNFHRFCNMNDQHGHPCKIHISTIPMNGESVEDVRNTWEKHTDYLEVWRPHNWAGGRRYRSSLRRKTTCGRPFNGPVQIQADGTVIPCCFLTNSEIVLGNCHDNRLVDILNDAPYAFLRAQHSTGILDGLPCATCDQLNCEDESPLIYSNRDPSMATGLTSTAKINVSKGEDQNDLYRKQI